jgi:probable rRNA maturation factor
LGYSGVTTYGRKAEAGRAIGEVVIVFTGDREIHDLNLRFRGKDKPTDVLSFIGEEEGHLGDLIISVKTLKRQAKEYRVTVSDELLRLVIHGTLHLLGYDHEGVPSSRAQAMRRRERQLFELATGRWR